jgi:proliferating cell nuclear antigen
MISLLRRVIRMNIILKSDIFKTVLKGMVSFLNEARFHFNKDGMHARAVDAANVAMVIVDIPADSFEVYKTNNEEEVIGVDVARLHNISKSMKNDELVDISIDKDSQELKVKYLNTTYSLALIDSSAIREEPKIPSLELPAKIVFDAGELKKAVQLSEKVDDKLAFRSQRDRFCIEADGDIDKITFTLDEAELKEFNKAEAKSMFSVASAGDSLTVRLGNDYPGRFLFEIGGNASIEYIVAPRIEVEE